MSVKHYEAKTFNSSASIGYLLKVAHTLVSLAVGKHLSRASTPDC